MTCPYCLATDKKYFKEGVCRRCLRYRNMTLVEEGPLTIGDSDYELTFELTKYQKETSRDIVMRLQSEDVFLEAVCGAGKTEMCYEVIHQFLSAGKSVGWAIPRRQVVLELAQRIQSNFKNLKVTPVCGGYTDDIQGDLILCTTHQLYRYHQYFDLLIVDEVDAYPFSNNDLLFDFMKRSVRGRLMIMSATMDEGLLSRFENMKPLFMPFRPDLKPLPIPILYRFFGSMWNHRNELRNEKVLVFVPTKRMAKMLGVLLSIAYITSKTNDKDRVIEDFRNKRKGILITTTVLERGVTFENVFVVVIQADHKVFTKASLIQIAGRVRRGKSIRGTCYFISYKKCEAVTSCIKQLKKTNAYAYSVLNQ